MIRNGKVRVVAHDKSNFPHSDNSISDLLKKILIPFLMPLIAFLLGFFITTFNNRISLLERDVVIVRENSSATANDINWIKLSLEEIKESQRQVLLEIRDK